MFGKFGVLAAVAFSVILASACAPERETAATSLTGALAQQDDGVIEVDIDLSVAPEQGEPSLPGDSLTGQVGYQLLRASSREVVSELAPRQARTLASVTKLSTALAALRNVPGVNVAEVSSMLKASNNYEASLFLRRFASAAAKITLPPPQFPGGRRGAAHSCPLNDSVEQPAAREVLSWLGKVVAVDWGNANLADGSGCNENNRMSPEQLVQTLRYADSLGTSFGGRDFASLLATGGGSGTLRSRLKDLGRHARVYAKTGTLSSAITLAGYLFVPGAKGVEKYYFAVLVDIRDGGGKQEARRYIDALVKSWARKAAAN